MDKCGFCHTSYEPRPLDGWDWDNPVQDATPSVVIDGVCSYCAVFHRAEVLAAGYRQKEEE